MAWFKRFYDRIMPDGGHLLTLREGKSFLAVKRTSKPPQPGMASCQMARMRGVIQTERT